MRGVTGGFVLQLMDLVQKGCIRAASIGLFTVEYLCLWLCTDINYGFLRIGTRMTRI